MPSINYTRLKEDDLMVIFAYAPAGLGHLRVTDALYKGLPTGTSPILLGSQDKGIVVVHRLVSLHPMVRSLFEWGQSQGAQEYVFTHFYRLSLRMSTKLLYKQVVTLLEQRIEKPKTLVIIATHFGLAHQIAALKEKIVREQKVNLVLMVVVTDDSPQFIWYVPGADLTFVPSSYTQNHLEKYGQKMKLAKTKFVVNPYPTSPDLARELTIHKWQERLSQLDEDEKNYIHVALPVSGAAVGMVFFVRLVDYLYQKCPRFMFHIIAKTSLYTLPYINDLMSRPYVKVHLSNLDKDAVNMYQTVYKQNNFSLEITKPSEQAFKALIKTNQIGGSLLLFAEPVGRQEIDNLNFLVKHQLLPNLTEQKYLWHLSDKGLPLEKSEYWSKAKNWRGVVLPYHSKRSGKFIWWAYQQGLFRVMMKHTQKVSYTKAHQEEVSSEGVSRFWAKVLEYLHRPN